MSSKKFDVLTVADACVDFFLKSTDITPEFGQKEKLIDDYGFELGGSGCIFACQAAKLNLRTACIGKVGNDVFGELVLDKLRHAGVILDFFKINENIKTGVTVSLCTASDRAMLTYPGSIDAVSREDITDEMLSAARHLHIGSFYLTKRLQGAYKDVVLKAKSRGLTVSMDTNWDPEEKWDGGIWDLLPYVDVFLPNENEAMAVAGADNPEDAVKILNSTVPIVALKQGGKGAAAYCRGEEFHCEPLGVKATDAIGAGDSFDAGFVYGFLKGLRIEECLKIGCVCGSMNTTCAGGTAGQVTLYRLNEILKRLQIK